MEQTTKRKSKMAKLILETIFSIYIYIFLVMPCLSQNLNYKTIIMEDKFPSVLMDSNCHNYRLKNYEVSTEINNKVMFIYDGIDIVCKHEQGVKNILETIVIDSISIPICGSFLASTTTITKILGNNDFLLINISYAYDDCSQAGKLWIYNKSNKCLILVDRFEAYENKGIWIKKIDNKIYLLYLKFLLKSQPIPNEIWRDYNLLENGGNLSFSYTLKYPHEDNLFSYSLSILDLKTKEKNYYDNIAVTTSQPIQIDGKDKYVGLFNSSMTYFLLDKLLIIKVK